MGFIPTKGEHLGVVKGDRRESKVEFDNTYFKIYEDCVRLTSNNFGAKEEIALKYAQYTYSTKKNVLKIVNDIGTNIRIANSIFPTCVEELRERRISQDKAIGLCFDLLTKYQLVMKMLKIKDDKYIIEIKNIIHEINCLKSWRTSDNKRFKNLG